MDVWALCVGNVEIMWRLLHPLGESSQSYFVQVSREYFGGSSRMPGVM